MFFAHFNGDGDGGGEGVCITLNVKQLFWLRWNLAHPGPMLQIQKTRLFGIICYGFQNNWCLQQELFYMQHGFGEVWFRSS